MAARLVAIGEVLPAGDGLGYFNRMYQLVTDAVNTHLGASAFADPAWIEQLDVTFGNLYLDAVRAASTGATVARAWGALLERRSDDSLAPLQLALAGMNAHINRDLPVAIVATCVQLGTTPEAGAHHLDFFRVNAVLAQVEPPIRELVEDMALGRVFPGLQDLVANFNMIKARETAWANALSLWLVHSVDPSRETLYVDALDRLTGFAGRGLLTRLSL
jgi:hypothetical protein